MVTPGSLPGEVESAKVERMGTIPAHGAIERLHFLDGLRGWGSVMVLLSHTYQCWLINPVGMSEAGYSGILQWINRTPLGVAMDGLLAVYIFFAISGFALSYPVLVSKAPHRTLANMALFRYPRLAIPILASAIFAFALWPYFVNVEADAFSHSQWLATFYRFPPSWQSLLTFSSHDVFLAYDGAKSWNPVLWTMPIELVGSFVVFGLVLLTRARPIRIALAVLYAAYYLQSPLCCFATGYLVAEYTMAKRQNAPRLGAVLLISSILLAISIRAFAISSQAVLTLTATAILLSISISPVLQKPLSSSISRLLGRLSFPLYLVHLPIICSLGSWLYVQIYPQSNFWVAALVVGPVVIAASFAVAVVFGKLIDDTVLDAAKNVVKAAVNQSIALLTYATAKVEPTASVVIRSFQILYRRQSAR